MEQIYNKLVRDRIPEIIKNNGEEPIIEILNDKEYKNELEKKLYEEYLEVIESKGESRLEELADMISVIASLAKLENKDLSDIINISTKKDEKRGSFDKKIYLKKVLINR